MNWQEFTLAAKEKGFSGVWCVSGERFAKWEAIVRGEPDSRWDGLSAAPQELMSGAHVVVLLRAYTPFSPFPEGSPSLDAYYPASQSAYRASQELAAMLQNAGFHADGAPSLPAKRCLLRTGLARYGRNGLLSVEGYGTRFNLQLVLTDATFPDMNSEPEMELSARCEHCSACKNACPAGAIRPGGRIDTALCLRAQSYSEPIPPEMRAKMGRSILGCDICQRACPRNVDVGEIAPPPELIDALRLERLLAGDVKPLAAFIGTNYARPVRMQARAALIAANLGRKDLLPQLEKLCESRFEHVREHAKWAVERLHEDHCL